MKKKALSETGNPVAKERELNLWGVRLQRLVESACGLLLQLDLQRGDLKDMLFSHGVETLIGRTEEELKQSPDSWLSIVMEEDRAGVESEIHLALSGESKNPLELRLLHRDGSPRWVRLHIFIERRESGEALLCDLLFLDITPARLAQTASQKTISRLNELVTLDALTGVLNRRGLTDELQRAWNIALRQRSSTGLLMLDLDYFKTINDTLGHLIGDGLLCEVAGLVRSLVRVEDVVCRFGGDEIVVLLPLTKPEETIAIGERILNTFRKHHFLVDKHRLSVRVSIGAACLSSVDTPGPDRLLREVDRALYRAKQGGRDRLCLGADPVRPEADIHDLKPITPDVSLGRVLVVDDDKSILRLTGAQLTRLGYHAITTQEASKALELARTEKGLIDIALIDLNLGEGKNGLEVITQISELDETIVGTILTGDATLPAALGALRHGAYDILLKPYTLDHLRILLDRAMKYRNLLRQRYDYRLHMEEMARRRSETLSHLTGQIESAYRATLETLAAVMDVRERQTGAHSGRVALITGILVRNMNLTGEDVDTFVEGALLHDIGKVGVPDAILLKPSPLTAEEWTVIRQHPATGYRFLKDNPLLQKVADIVHQHQERLDGSGYPQGLKGDEICLGARVFAVADSYDAIRSNRPYDAARDAQTALAEIVTGRGTIFDPKVVDAFVLAQDEIESTCNWPSPSEAANPKQRAP